MSDEHPRPEPPRVEFKVMLKGRRPRPPMASQGAGSLADPAPEAVPRVARLLALAHRWQRLIDQGQVESQAEIARVMGLSRARVSQVMELRWLAPAVQEAILMPNGPGAPRCSLEERALRRIATRAAWADQLAE
jgi:predicted XRE-type DNA-binding protein